MSMLINDMEMPESCDKCRFCVNGFTDEAPMYECGVQSYDNVSVLVESSGKPFDFRPDWCPLTEVKEPHGRLIDADAIQDYNVETFGQRLLIIDTAPTVIEAERIEE